MTVTIKDVAKASHVSVATVSRVLNDLGGYSDKTKNNVLKAVATETSIDWTVNEVLSNLVAERIAISKGDFTDQHGK